jgi:glycine dehydrogenase subunit 2
MAATSSSSAEPTLFEQSRPGARAVSLPEAQTSLGQWLPSHLLRARPPRLPEVSQLEVVRHFVRLSQKNHSIDTGFYPLGSCTMKFNPKVCDRLASLEGFANLHPETPEADCQGTLALMYGLQALLTAITGFDAATLQPAAGAQGELVGMRMVQAYFQHRGEAQRQEVLIPDSAHGTNPASAQMCGFRVVELKSGSDGLVDLQRLEAALSPRTAAVMLTNPNTAGLFEKDILEISQRVHAAGGLMYYDGANLNAIVGQVQPAAMGFDVMHINTHKTFATPHGGGGPGCGPVAVNEKLAPFLPAPLVTCRNGTYFLDYQRPLSIGRVKTFWGNVEMMVRAYTYLLAYGWRGLAQVSSDAVLNANYLRVHLQDAYHLAFPGLCKHEFVLNSQKQRVHHPGLTAMALAKRLMDYGFHPPTVYFPLIVQEAMMIEPTDTESKATLDTFIAAMRAIAQECETQPQWVLDAPHTTDIARVDEVAAAKRLDLNYFAASAAA